MEYWHPLYLVLTHFIFDWMLQPRRVAKDKQESMLTAITHGLYVSIPLLFIFDLPLTILYALLHSLQDRYIYGIERKLPFVGPRIPPDIHSSSRPNVALYCDVSIVLSTVYKILT